MNCLVCLGRLWLQDEKGDYFRCGECNATGERKENGRKMVIDLERYRRERRTRVDVPPSTGDDAA
jgi:hypothetical protein